MYGWNYYNEDYCNSLLYARAVVQNEKGKQYSGNISLRKFRAYIL